MKKENYRNIKNVLRKLTDTPCSPILLWELNVEIEKLLKKQLGDYTCSVDVSLLAEKMHLNIVEDFEFSKYEDKNHFSPLICKYSKTKDFIRGKPENYIYIRRGQASVTSVWRFAIAYGIALQIFFDEDIEAFNEYREPMLHNSVDDIIVTNFALLLLMPVSTVANLLCEFAQKTKYGNITSENWLRLLSEENGVPIDIANNAYQLTRNIFGMADQINDPKLFKLKKKCSKMIY